MPPALHLLDGRPWSDSPWVDPLSLLGCYTSFAVEPDGTAARLADHLVRLEVDSAVLFGRSVLRQDVLHAAAVHVARSGTPVRLRVAVVGRTPPLQPQDVLSLHVATSSRPVAPAPEVTWRVRTLQQVRRLPEVKAVDPYLLVLRQQARWAGFDDALLARGDDLLEGTTWGLVAFTASSVVVPTQDVLRSTGALRVVEAAGLPVEHRPVRRAELASLRLLVGTNAVVPVTAVSAVDGRAVPVDRALLRELRAVCATAPRSPLG